MVRVLGLLLLVAPVYGQTGARFDVASIKPTDRALWGGGSGGHTGKGRFTMNNVTLKRCIQSAYGVGPNQILGGPDWMDVEHFEIAAKAETAVDDGALNEMVKTLLAERFHLVLRRETRMLPAIVIEVAKGGPKLVKTEATESSTQNGRGLIDAKAITMDGLAEKLARQMDMPVVNRTGIEGAFDLRLEWKAEGATIFEAMQGLGLRLRSQKSPIEVIVVEKAERPTAN